MGHITDTGRLSRLALVGASVALILAGCATTASYRPEIDSMKAALADAKAAGAETLAPEEYARAEACLDWFTHEATEFNPFADPDARQFVGKCRAPLQALKDKMAAARVAKPPAQPVAPPVEAPKPAAEEGVYPAMGTLEGALAALPPAEAPPAPAPSEAEAPAEAPAPAPAPPAVAAKEEAAPEAAPAAAPELGAYPSTGTLEGALAALPPAEAPPAPAPSEAEAPAEAPAAAPELGAYPSTGTLEGALAALPPAEAPAPAPAPPAVAAKEEAAPAAAPAPTPPPIAKAPEKEKEPPLKDIFFDYDKSLIRPDARQTLDQNIEWLRGNPKASIIIEGHCDERGTPEYNLGLGQRRAQAAQDYLVASGVDDKRIKIISYGKERPFVVGHDESAWKWNRRAHFVLP